MSRIYLIHIALRESVIALSEANPADRAPLQARPHLVLAFLSVGTRTRSECLYSWPSLGVAAVHLAIAAVWVAYHCIEQNMSDLGGRAMKLDRDMSGA
jgi:hypothetical protein